MKMSIRKCHKQRYGDNHEDNSRTFGSNAEDDGENKKRKGEPGEALSEERHPSIEKEGKRKDESNVDIHLGSGDREHWLESDHGRKEERDQLRKTNFSSSEIGEEDREYTKDN